MVALWCVLGLIAATISVSTLGAAFSVFGLSQLFSGAALAVSAMATSLEFAKFILAAYLHQRWNHTNILLKTYLLSAIVVLSGITSMGIFGFLSNAYQSASTALDSETIKIESLKIEQSRKLDEINRIHKSIDDIPANRITKRLKYQEEVTPTLNLLTKEAEQLGQQITQVNLRILDVKQKVGPLIYISRAFKMNIDDVVKYLILVFVGVFDPLAICLVIATSEALESRRRGQQTATRPAFATAPPPETPEAASSDVIQMRFADDPDQNAG